MVLLKKWPEGGALVRGKFTGTKAKDHLTKGAGALVLNFIIMHSCSYYYVHLLYTFCSYWKHFLNVVAYNPTFIFCTNIQTSLFFLPGWDLLCVNSTNIQQNVLHFLIYINIMMFSLISWIVNTLGIQFHLVLHIRIISDFFLIL